METSVFLDELERLDKKYQEALALNKEQFTAVNAILSERIKDAFIVYLMWAGLRVDGYTDGQIAAVINRTYARMIDEAKIKDSRIGGTKYQNEITESFKIATDNSKDKNKIDVSEPVDISNLDGIVTHKQSAFNELLTIQKKYTKKIEEAKRIDEISGTNSQEKRVTKEYEKVVESAKTNYRYLLSIRGTDGVSRRYSTAVYGGIFVDNVLGVQEMNNAVKDSIKTGRSDDVSNTVLQIPTRGSTDACRFYEGKYVSVDGTKTQAVINGNTVNLYSLPLLLSNRRDIYHPHCRHYGLIAVMVDEVL